MKRMTRPTEVRNRLEELRKEIPIVRNPFDEVATVNELVTLLRTDKDYKYFINYSIDENYEFGLLWPESFIPVRTLSKSIVEIGVIDDKDMDENYTGLYLEVR